MVFFKDLIENKTDETGTIKQKRNIGSIPNNKHKNNFYYLVYRFFHFVPLLFPSLSLIEKQRALKTYNELIIRKLPKAELVRLCHDA